MRDVLLGFGMATACALEAGPGTALLALGFMGLAFLVSPVASPADAPRPQGGQRPSEPPPRPTPQRPRTAGGGGGSPPPCWHGLTDGPHR